MSESNDRSVAKEEEKEELSSITPEELALLLEHEELTPELQDLIEQYQQATSSLQDSAPQAKEEEEKEQHIYPVGSHCAITFEFQHYELLLLPAIILSYTLTRDEAQVLVTTPITMDTIPCSHYFSHQQQQQEEACPPLCPYSHGYTVPIDYILPFEALETDTKIQNLEYGKKVWCKKEGDEIWKLGNIIDQLHGPRWRVRLKKKNKEPRGKKRAILNVDLDHIMPFKGLDNYDSEDGDKEEWSESDRESVYDDDEITAVDNSYIRADESTWGSWQVHTTGFAAKMMKKMGYVEGKGLGLDGEGRVDPIEAKPYVNQQSSDINSRPGLGLKEIGPKKKKKEATQQPKVEKEELDIFGLMNTLLGGEDKKDEKKSTTNISSSNAKIKSQEINKKIAVLQSQLDKAQKEYVHATEAYRRNKSSLLEKQFAEKLKSTTSQFDTLKKQMDQVQRHAKAAKEKKDMYTF